MPAFSQLAAFHLRDIARVLPIMNDLVNTMENDQGLRTLPSTGPRMIDLVRQQSGRLLDELGVLIESLRQTNLGRPGRNTLIAELEGLLDLAQRFDRSLTSQPSARDLVDSVRTLRSRAWSIEPRFVERVRDRRLADRWRSVRRQFDAIADRIGVARVIAPGAAARPAAAIDRRLLAQADRAVAAVDSMLTVRPDDPPSGPGGMRYQRELENWRRKVLEFRQQAASGESAEVLARSLREVEELTRRLGQRSRSEARIYRGGARLDARGLQPPSLAVEKLRELMPRTGDLTRPSLPQLRDPEKRP